MANNRTFTMIKPDAVQDGHIGAILSHINQAGFRIVAMKLTRLSQSTAGKFYEVHGSDSEENAALESAFHFAGTEEY